MADYKSGVRESSVPTRSSVVLMTSLAKDITDAEVEAAAAYFSALKPRANIKVVETDVVPKTCRRMFLSASNSGEEAPIGKRIIEVPEVLEQIRKS